MGLEITRVILSLLGPWNFYINRFSFIIDTPESPAAPEVSDVTANSLKLTWQAPAKDGKSAILKYIIEYRKTGEKDWTLVSDSVTSKSYVFQDLTPRTSYRFRVSAENKIGKSRPSRSSTVIETKK